MTLPVAVAPTTSSSSTGSTSSTSSSTSSDISQANSSLQSNQQMFMTLLTAQLKNQDPLSPMDPTAFTQQLVTMNGVQQQILTNQLLQQLVTRQTSVGDPVSLIGKTVTASTPSGVLANGQAQWVYDIPAAANVSVQVQDANSQVVYAQSLGTQTAGEHTFSWNGTSLTGTQAAAGAYTISVTAKDANGNTLSTDTYQRGVVSSVETINGEPMLNINGLGVPMSDVTSVDSATSSTSNSSSSTASQAAIQAVKQALTQ